MDVVQHNRNCSTGHNAAKPFAGFISPTIQVPSCLESFGSAKQSCQRIYKFLQTLDFQVRYFVTQTQEVISWLQQRLATIAEALQTTASRLTKLELLVYTIDTDLALVEEKLLWVPQRNVQPKKQPRQPSAAKHSGAHVRRKKTSFRQRSRKRKVGVTFTGPGILTIRTPPTFLFFLHLPGEGC